MTHLDMLRALAEANRQHDWTEAARLKTLITTPTPCATPAEAAYCASNDTAQEDETPYTVTVQTAPGEGDRGTDERTVAHRHFSITTLARLIKKLEYTGHHVSVWRGQGLGICQYETEQVGYLAD